MSIKNNDLMMQFPRVILDHFWPFTPPSFHSICPSFRTIIGDKNTFFVFAVCDKHPLSRSFTNTHFEDYFLIAVQYYEMRHPTLQNIYKYNAKPYLRRCILSNKIVCFSSMVFLPVLIFCLFLHKYSDAKLCLL